MTQQHRAILVILDGFGLRDERAGNAIRLAHAPTLTRLLEREPHTHLETSGEAVGLPEGQMGNSEVGHMNIGAGRIIHQTLTRIDKSIEDGTFFENPALVEAVDHAAVNGTTLHLMGLVSDGGVHSSARHLHALVDLARRRGLPGERVVVHVFTDGRDTGPTTGRGHVEALLRHMDGYGRIGSVSGRYYAMDRDRRWDRTKRAYDVVARADGKRVASAPEAIQASYEAGMTDEFVEPVVVEGYGGMGDGDAAIFFNFRPDRARQLTRALTEEGFSGFPVPDRPRVHLATTTRYHETFTHPVAFHKENVEKPLGRVVSDAGLTQLRIAETEKYAHVTYFLNGGQEVEYPGESRILVPSPKVPTYDHQPEMSAAEVTARVVEALEGEAFDLVVLNYANCDMVGHTGDIDATVRAVEVVDEGLARILDAAAAHGYEVLVTADHGNAEEMVDADGGPQTAHTTLPVPFVYVGRRRDVRLRPGILADVAPTLVDVMGLPKPEDWTGTSLFEAYKE